MLKKRSKTKKIRLSVFLIKDDCSDQSDILKDSSILAEYPVKGFKKEEAILYVKESRPNPPKWMRFFSDKLATPLENLFVSSTSAALILKKENRYFVFTFGFGHCLIAPKSIEESFGLKVVLNSIDSEKIKSVDIKNLDTVLRYSKVQTSQASSVDSFGMNIDRDILNAVTGVSSDEALGKQITGAVSLHVSLPINLEELPDFCKKLLKRFHEKSYQETFPWVDHIAEIKDPDTRDELNKYLVDAIKKKESEGLFLAPPELLDWERVEGFKYKEDEELVREDVHIQDVLPPDSELSERLSLDWLKRKEIVCVGKEDEQTVKKWSLYNCINFEINKGPNVFLLTAGRWFRINADYASVVNEEINVIPEYSGFLFPDCGEEETEGQYNERVSMSYASKCFLMDKKLIVHGGGRSKLEFCDLLINRSDFVHVKRFRGSGTMSHLFFQGFNSAFLFLTDKAFVEKANKLLPAVLKFNETKMVKTIDCEIVFAVISKTKSSIKSSFPFFSRISLIQTYKQLRAFGYKVSVAKIKMTNKK